MADEWITTGEAAKLLGVSRATIVRYVNAGILEARTLPSGNRRIRRADAERLAQEADKPR